MGLIIKKKKHLWTRLPLWFVIILILGFLPAIAGMIGATISEISTGQPSHEGNCSWMVLPWFTMFTLPAAGLALLILFIIVIIDSIRLARNNKDISLSNKVLDLSNPASLSLYEYKDADISISMSLRFDEQNGLIFDGYDTGKKVLELKGDSDYEYKYTIEADEVKKLYALFKIKADNRKALLNRLKELFHENDAFSKFGAFMTENNIKYSSFFWE